MRRPDPARVREMVRKELRQMFRDPKMKRIIFAAPVIQLLLFGYAVNTDIRQTRTFVVDHDRTFESRRLQDAFTASGYFHITGRSERPADLTRALDRGDAVLGLEIPAGFQRDLRAARGASVQVLVDGTNSNTGTVARGYAARIVARFAQRASRQAARGATRRAAQGEGGSAESGGIETRSRAWYNPELESRMYNVPAVIGVLLMLMCLLLTSLGVVREREVGTLDQLRVTPLRPVELMLGKTLPVALVALLDLVLITSLALLWFHVPLRGPAVDLLLASLVYILAGLSFGLLISTISDTQQEAFMTMFLFFLPAIVLSGFMYPVSTMPPLFQWLTLLNPVRHFLEIVRGIFLKGDGLRQLWPQFTILFAMAVGALGLATARFRAHAA